MAFKAILLCVSVLFFQAFSPSLGRHYQPLSSSSCGCQSISIPSSGGALGITVVGPVSPFGIAVATNLGLAGDLDVSGALPYLSAVAFESQFDTSGSACVSYGCGDCVAITNQIGGLPSVSGCGR